MSGNVRCAAAPDDLVTFGAVTTPLAAVLRVAAARLVETGEVPAGVRAVAGAEVASAVALLREAAEELEAAAVFARRVASAFRLAASSGGAFLDGAVVVTGDGAVDRGLRAAWSPEGHIERSPGEWSEVLRPLPCASTGPTYRGNSSVLVGPDGRRYPLVAPTLVGPHGDEVNADDPRRGSGPGGVADLFGADPGWEVVDERVGVAGSGFPTDFWSRVLSGVGASVVGAPRGASDEELDALAHDRPSEAEVTHVLSMPAVPPENAGEVRAVASGLVPNLVQLAPAIADGLVGFLDGDRGSHHGYVAVFEQHPDGRLRARLTHIYVDPTKSGAERVTTRLVVGGDRLAADLLVPLPPSR